MSYAQLLEPASNASRPVSQGYRGRRIQARSAEDRPTSGSATGRPSSQPGSVQFSGGFSSVAGGGFISVVVVDRFYIALFSALEQTHCARM